MMVRVECPFDGEIFWESGGGEMNQQIVEIGKVMGGKQGGSKCRKTSQLSQNSKLKNLTKVLLSRRVISFWKILFGLSIG